MVGCMGWFMLDVVRVLFFFIAGVLVYRQARKFMK
jgi:hypothetical protein